MMRIFTYVYALFVCMSLLPFHSNAGAHLFSQFEDIIQQARVENGFNGTVAIQVANLPTFTYSIGFQQGTIPLTGLHLFSSGSVGKEFTTVAILRLMQDGNLALNDTITDYIPNLPGWATNITVAHLLSHTSGLPKIKWKKDITTEDVMAQLQQLDALAFEPGSGYLYGNINVMLRANIVEAITEMSFARYLKIHMLDPLNMKNTLQVTDLHPMKNKVIGDYTTAINGVTIYTTANDLLLWEQALVNGKAFSDRAHYAEYDFGTFTRVNGSIVAIKHDGSNPSHHVLKYNNIANLFTFVAMSSDGNKQTLYSLKDRIEKLVLSSEQVKLLSDIH